MSNMWGNLISGGLGLLQNFVSGRNSAKAADRAFSYSKILQDRQYQYTRELNRNAYQDTTYSMRQAGINPMLAISNGVNSLSGPSGSVPSVTPADTGISSALAYLQYKREKKLAESTIDVNKNTSAKIASETKYNNLMTSIQEKFAPLKALAEIDNIKANTAKSLQDIKNSISSTAAYVSNLRENTAKSKYENTLNARTSKWHKDHPYQTDWQYGLGRWFRSVGSMFH